jgi:hypothetical protein
VGFRKGVGFSPKQTSARNNEKKLMSHFDIKAVVLTDFTPSPLRIRGIGRAFEADIIISLCGCVDQSPIQYTVACCLCTINI